MKGGWLISIICAVLFAISPLTASMHVEAHKDQDVNGLWRNYNTDNSMESSIRTDLDDDTIQKAFFVSSVEYNDASRVYLWVYAKCWGTKDSNSANTHAIKIDTTTGIHTIRQFRCFELFSYDKFQWQMFEFPKTDFEADKWVIVEIEDIDWDWTKYNMEFGIDTSYGAVPTHPGQSNILIKDWDQSYWYSAGAGVTPLDETKITGELMIKLEFANRRKEISSVPINFERSYTGPYNYIPIDDANDKIRWRTFANELTPNDIAASSYARLYIYGYSWLGGTDPNPPLTDNYFVIKINGINFPWDPDNYYARTNPIGQWFYFQFDPTGILQGGVQNTFEFTDTSWDYVRHNLAVIKFSDIDDQRSAWYYSPGGGQWIGDPNLDYTKCQGELGIYLFLYQKYEPSKIVGGVSVSCEDHVNHKCGYYNANHDQLSSPTIASRIASDLDNNYGWIDELKHITHTADPPYTVYEGQFASEFYLNDYCGDSCDLVIYDGHGSWSAGMTLPDYNFDSGVWPQSQGRGTDEDISLTIDGYQYGEGPGKICGKPETDNWNYAIDSHTGYSEDGFNFNAAYILLLSCEILSGFDGIKTLDCPYQTMLYHGAHILLGFSTDLSATPQEQADFADELVDQWCDNHLKVIEGYISAVTNILNRNGPDNRYIIYYHNSNRNDYLWDEGTVAQDYDFIVGYEDRDIKGIADMG